MHLPESQDATGAPDLIADYLAQTPLPTLPKLTSEYLLTADASDGDQFVRVRDDGAWAIGRSVEIGIVERYHVVGRGEPVFDETRFTLDRARPAPLRCESDEHAGQVTFTDDRGRTLATATLRTLEGDQLSVDTLADSLLDELDGARVDLRLSVERRRITRIQCATRPSPDGGPHDAILLLDRPLLVDHRVEDRHGVAPLDRLFLRRFAGATWDAHVSLPDEEQEDVGIDHGLHVRLTRECDQPVWRAGEGWTVWTRDMGYREALYDAPVDDPPVIRAPLAFLEVTDDGVTITDLRAGRRGRDRLSEQIAVIEARYAIRIGDVEIEGELVEVDEEESAMVESVGRLGATPAAPWDRVDPIARQLLGRLQQALREQDTQQAEALLNALRSRKSGEGGAP